MLWSKDVWAVLAAALRTCALVRLVVITGPGQDVLPWDRSKCRHPRGAKRCSGEIGCQVDRAAAERWEADLQRNWRLLRQAVVTACNRAGFSSPLLALVLEDQKRGVVHYNVVMKDGPAGALVHRLLCERSERYGFGYTHDDAKRMPGIVSASYLAGYLTNKGERKGDASMQSIAARWEARRRLWWVSPKLTKQTYVTMTTLRHGRRVLGAQSGYCPMPTEGVAIVGWSAVDMASGAVLHEVWSRDGDLPDEAEARACVRAAYSLRG